MLKKETKEKRVAFFIYYYTLGTSSTILNSINVLSNNGFKVDIFAYRAFYTENVHFNKNVNFYNFDAINTLGIVVKPNKIKTMLKQNKLIFNFLFTILNNIKKIRGAVKSFFCTYFYQKELKNYIPEEIKTKINNIIQKEQYLCFFGMDAFGLVFANCFNKTINVPIIYFSLELYLKDTYKLLAELREFHIMKKYESKLHQQSVFAIIQDEEREKLLNEDNKVYKKKTLYVPVSVLGKRITTKTDWFRKKYKIPESKKIILALGGITPHKVSLEIASGAQLLPDDFVLIFHGSGNSAYLNKIRLADKTKKIIISDMLIEYDKLPELVASADLGIVGFSSITKNFQNVGSACGGLALYMQCGLPVIAINSLSIGKVLDENNCGIAVKEKNDIPEAVNQIMKDYSTYRANAFNCFEKKYEFSKYFNKVINEIDKMVK